MTIEESNYKLTGGVAVTTTVEKEGWDGNVAIFFDYISDETNTGEASITDNYVESGYSIQDHITIKPRVYRLRGYVGEVVFKNTSKWTGKLFSEDFLKNHPIWAKTTQIIKPINALSGIVSNYTQAAINVVDQVESSFNRYKQIYNAFRDKNQEFVGKRQKAVNSILLNILEQRRPIKIIDLQFDKVSIDNIKFEEDKTYFIQSVSSHQGDNAFISDYEVVIKEFRIVSAKTTKVDKSQFAGDLASEKTTTANNGKANSLKVDKPIGDMLKKAETIQSADTGIKSYCKTLYNQAVEELKLWWNK